jgi:hypothetical protein
MAVIMGLLCPDALRRTHLEVMRALKVWGLGGIDVVPAVFVQQRRLQVFQQGILWLLCLDTKRLDGRSSSAGFICNQLLHSACVAHAVLVLCGHMQFWCCD